MILIIEFFIAAGILLFSLVRLFGGGWIAYIIDWTSALSGTSSSPSDYKEANRDYPPARGFFWKLVYLSLILVSAYWMVSIILSYPF